MKEDRIVWWKAEITFLRIILVKKMYFYVVYVVSDFWVLLNVHSSCQDIVNLKQMSVQVQLDHIDQKKCIA